MAATCVQKISYLGLSTCLLCVLLQLSLVVRVDSADLECLACSYTFAGHDGLYDIDCVRNPTNFSKTIPVKCRQGYCSITAVYSRGYDTLTSLSRGCKAVEENNCNDPNSIIPRCEYRCSQPRCNHIDGNIWPRIGRDSSGNQGNSASKLLLSSFTLVFFVCLACLLQ